MTSRIELKQQIAQLEREFRTTPSMMGGTKFHIWEQITKLRSAQYATQPWDGICVEACWNAEEEKCVCHCDGVNHGRGVNELGAVMPSSIF